MDTKDSNQLGKSQDSFKKLGNTLVDLITVQGLEETYQTIKNYNNLDYLVSVENYVKKEKMFEGYEFDLFPTKKRYVKRINVYYVLKIYKKSDADKDITVIN